MRMRLFSVCLMAAGAMPVASCEGVAGDWQAGISRVNITPQESMWMSGYASRDHGAESKLTDLWAKTIVIEDPSGNRIAAVTLDLVGVSRPTSAAIRDGIEQAYGIPWSNIGLFCSHTHTGPVVGGNLRSMFELDDAEIRKIDDYTDKLIADVVASVGEATGNLEPARLTWACGTATYAVNRRTNREADVPMLREQGLLNGPVDHDVPVLAVRTTGNTLKAVLFGYACHATVLSSYEWSGDHPGFAMMALEEQYPGVQAMFWAGCGADQNPLPRRTPELAEKYGRMLADAVHHVLNGAMHPISGELQTAYAEIDLGFATIPTRDELQETLKSENRYKRVRAALLLQQVESMGQVPPSYPYPVQTWKLGDGPLWCILGGEVVVDYSLRLKDELGAGTTWVAGYANDVMAYIASLRVLKEGGYEGADSMLYYGLPSPWADNVEERIVAEAHRQAKLVGASD